MESIIDISSVLHRVASLPDGEAMSTDDAKALEELLAAKPYFSAAVLLLLRHGGDAVDDERRLALQQHLALTASDRRTLAYGELGDEWANFYPPTAEEATPDTENVIDTFLRTYGSCSPEEEKQLERMIFNPTPDYAELLARQEQSELPEEDSAPEGSQDALINAFIRSQHPSVHKAEELPPPPAPDATPASKPDEADDSLLSESLAKIFVRQQRYERAFEIISGLSLKFPKKSAYFADQLRFLQKLIINQRRQQELKQSGAAEK